MTKAKVGKRIGAFFLDSIIVSLVATLFSSLAEDPTYLAQVAEIETLYAQGQIDLLQYSEAMGALVDPNLWLKQLISLVFTIGYFIVLPHFWKDQTLGRKITKIKVVQENSEPAKLKHFIVREGFGQALFSSVLTFLGTVTGVTLIVSLSSVVDIVIGFVLLIGFFSMLGSKKTTLYDRWSKTLMVSAVDTPADELDIAATKPADEDVIDL